MHRKEYILIATCINRELKRESCQVTMKRLIDDFCEELLKDNKLFSREAFIEECWKGVA